MLWVQALHKVFTILRYMQKRTFTETLQTPVKFNCKTDHLVKEKFCIRNLSDQWTTSESEKTGLYGKIYDFIVDYKQIAGVKAIYDMYRYLMTKYNISP